MLPGIPHQVIVPSGHPPELPFPAWPHHRTLRHAGQGFDLKPVACGNWREDSPVGFFPVCRSGIPSFRPEVHHPCTTPPRHTATARGHSPFTFPAAASTTSVLRHHTSCPGPIETLSRATIRFALLVRFSQIINFIFIFHIDMVHSLLFVIGLKPDWIHS